MTKQFIDEVNEDIQEEKIAVFWKKYRYYIIGLIVLIIGSTSAMVGYDTYKANKIDQESKIYESYLAKGDLKKLDDLIENAEYGSQFIAVIEKAKQTAKSNPNQASKILYEFATDADSPEKEYAILSSVWVVMGVEKPDLLLGRLNEIEIPEYKTIADFTRVEIYLMQDKKTDAIKVLNEIKNSNNPYYNKIATDLLTVITK